MIKLNCWTTVEMIVLLHLLVRFVGWRGDTTSSVTIIYCFVCKHWINILFSGKKNPVLCTIQLEPWIMWLYRLLWPYSLFLLELGNSPRSAQFIVHYADMLPQCSLSYQQFYIISLISFCRIVASVFSHELESLHFREHNDWKVSVQSSDMNSCSHCH